MRIKIGAAIDKRIYTSSYALHFICRASHAAGQPDPGTARTPMRCVQNLPPAGEARVDHMGPERSQTLAEIVEVFVMRRPFGFHRQALVLLSGGLLQAPDSTA